MRTTKRLNEIFIKIDDLGLLSGYRSTSVDVFAGVMIRLSVYVGMPTEDGVHSG